MTLFERIKSLANRKGKNMKEVAIELGFSENLFYRWKTTDPKGVDLEKVADYFDVSVDYLLGREESTTQKETDLRKALENAVSFDGEELTENDKDALIAYMMGRKGKWGEVTW